MDCLDHGMDSVDGRLRGHPMAEVEDMACVTRVIADRMDAATDFLRRREQGHGVQVALDGSAGTENLPGVPQVHPPVQPECVRSGLVKA